MEKLYPARAVRPAPSLPVRSVLCSIAAACLSSALSSLASRRVFLTADAGVEVPSMVHGDQGSRGIPTTTRPCPPPILTICPSDPDLSSLPSSIQLTRAATSAFASWVPTLAPWELYLTLTYDPKREGVDYVRPSSFACLRHLRKFHLQASEATRRPTYLCGALENTRAGWPHWHGLLSTGDLSTREFQLLSAAWFSAHGYAHFQRVQPGTAPVVAAYCAKYLTKQGSEVELLGPWQTRTAVLQATLDGALRRPGSRR